MADLLFLDDSHADFFHEKIGQLEEEGHTADVYFKSLVYLCGLVSETRDNFGSIYSWTDRTINLDALSAGWQTGGTYRITRLAFNLWNGCGSDSPDGELISSMFLPDNLFCCSFMEYFFQAIRLRFPEYCLYR